jgi:hypothetical protein
MRTDMGDIVQLFPSKSNVIPLPVKPVNKYLDVLNRADNRLKLPPWLVVLLWFKSELEVVDRDNGNKIYAYKELRGKTYEIRYTGCIRISGEEYKRMFGIS